LAPKLLGAVVAGHPPPLKVVTFAVLLAGEYICLPPSLAVTVKGIGGILG